MLPIKQVNGAIVYVRDVATVSSGYAFQTNVVRQDGHRGVLITVLKAGNASTLSVVKGIRALLPRVLQIVPPNLKITPLERSERLCARGGFRGDSRSSDRGRADRPHDPAVSRQLAIHASSSPSPFRSLFSPRSSS